MSPLLAVLNSVLSLEELHQAPDLRQRQRQGDSCLCLPQENCKEGELRAIRKPGTSCLAPQEDTRTQFLAAEAKETTAVMWELERGPTMSNTCGQLFVSILM